MQKVITINLNGNAYHVEEAGFDALRAYLDQATARLKDNPDRDEIVRDLEQAIAEKSAGYQSSHKNVVTSREVEQILAEMGPVKDPEERDTATAGGTGGKTATEATGTSAEAPKRLYQISEGAMISGLCNGIAAYLHVDVTLVRIIFVVLAVLTKGIWVLVYAVLALIIPYASTAEERAAAHGLPFNAQELIDRAKKNYRRQQRHWARTWRRSTHAPRDLSDAPPRAVYVTQVATGALAPVFALVQAAAFVVLVLAIISLVNTNAVFGWELPAQVPLWAGILGLVILYQVLMGPLRAAAFSPVYVQGRYEYGPARAWAGALSFAATCFGLWLAYQYVPEVREFVHSLPFIIREVWESVASR
jgi:phage shock protein PspC (stress-responsive transcriptional regulator)